MRSNAIAARRLWLAVALLVPLAVAVPAFAVSSSTTLPNGAQLDVSLDSPVAGTQILADGAPASVPVSGTAAIGIGPPSATAIYVFDASGSTAGSGGACGSVLVCQQTFFTGLNTAATASGAVAHTGLVVFGADAVRGDMTPAGGDDALGLPTDAGTPIASIGLTGGGFGYEIGQYTAKSGNANGTNYVAGLQQALAVLAASTDPAKFVVFASDGLSNQGSLADFTTAVAALHATGAIVDSVAIGGSSACTGGTAGDLAAIAGNGGSCHTVADPNDLPDLIPELVGSTLTKLELTVDGGAPSAITTSPATPQAGPASVTYSTATSGLNPGSHDLCVRAFGTDVTGGAADTAACVAVGVYDLELAPASATNELGVDNSHTVTATLEGPAGAVGGYLVTFAVGGKNAGTVGTCLPADCRTDASGQVTFTYSVPVDPASIGVDTIDASVTLGSPNGETDTEQVTKTWADTTAPTATCAPTTNPSGGNTPPAGSNPSSGQNPDGFYVLRATDAVDPSPTVTISDSASGFTAGPWPSGTTIKLVQAPGATPSVRPGPGVINWHVTLNGDAIVTATDAAGNASSIRCLVPPPPK